MDAEPIYPALSPRQLSVLKMLADGSRIDRMSGELELHPATISAHVSALKKKWDAKTDAELVARGYQLGVLE